MPSFLRNSCFVMFIPALEPEAFTVFSISKTCIVSVFLGDGAMIYLFCAAITDIGRLIQSFALFLHKILASLITGGAGSAFYIAENDFSDIGFRQWKR